MGGVVIEIWALCVDDAKILAQAQAIKDAMPKQVLTIVQINED